MAKTDIVPDFGGRRVAEVMGFAENPVNQFPPGLIQHVPATRAQEGVYCSPRQSCYHLYLQVPKEILCWETPSCFSRASKSMSRSTYLGWKAVPGSEVWSVQGGECPLPLSPRWGWLTADVSWICDSRFSSIRELAGTLPRQVDFMALFSAVPLILTFDSNCVLGDGSYIVATFWNANCQTKV